MFDDRGVSKVVAVVLLVALTVVLAMMATFTFTQVDVGQEPQSVTLDISVDRDSGELVIVHDGGDSIDLEASRMVVEGPAGEVVVNDEVADGSFESGDEVRIPLSAVGTGSEVDVVLESPSGDGQSLATYSVPGDVDVAPTGWHSVGGTAGATRAPYDTAAHSASRTVKSGELSAVAVGDEGRIFYQKRGQSTFAAYDPDTDSTVWSHPEAPTSNPVVVDGTVYAGFDDGSDRNITAFDAQTGAVVADFDVGVVVDGLATDGEYLYATAGQYVYAFDVETGARAWRYDNGVDVQPPTVSNGTLLLSEAGGLGATGRVALDTDDGSVEWTHSAGVSYHSPAVEDGTAFTKDGSSLVALSVADGSVEWSTGLGDTTVGTVAVHDGTVFAMTDENEVVALDAETGTIQWRTQVHSAGAFDPTFSRTTKLTVTDDTVYAGVSGFSSSELYALDRSDGSERWRQSLSSGNAPVTFPIEDDIVVWYDG